MGKQQQSSLPDKDLRILEAAKRIFVKKGLDGAVMQDIADEAGINRTALHYYFRSKQKLFEAVFNDLFDHFLPRVEKTIHGDGSFEDKITWFVDHYLDLLRENPYLPNFVMNELNKNPDGIVERFASRGILTNPTRQWLKAELNRHNSTVPATQFMANLISLCVFPFIARPLLQEIILDTRETDAFDRFIEERKSVIVHTLMRSIASDEQPGTGCQSSGGRGGNKP